MKADVAVVSEHFWRSKLASDPNVLGRSLTLNGVPTTIVGVIPTMPISWFGPDCEIWGVKPFDLPGTPKDLLMRGVSFMRMIGRLKPGVTVDQAKANLLAVQESYHRENAEKADNTWQPVLVSAPEDATGQLRPAFLTLLGAVAFVLLIACSNVANLLLVRFTGRRREIALRVALGASRSSIVRLFVIESTLLSLIAAVLGIFLALWALPLVPKLAGQNVPLESATALNLPVLAFTLIVSLGVGLLMGMYPALQSSRSDLVDGLKDGGRAISGSAGTTSIPSWSRRRAGLSFRCSARRRGFAHHEFPAPNERKRRLPCRSHLDWWHWIATGALSGQCILRSVRQTFAGRTANCAWR